MDQLPPEMLAAKRWLVWRQEHGRKVPYYASGVRRHGTLDSPEDIACFADFQTALAALQRDPSFSGLGFALGPDGEGRWWQGIDLDDIAEKGLQPLADRLPGYVEVTPSGDGHHAIGRGARFMNREQEGGDGQEAYCYQRFFTVTGNAVRCPDGTLPDLTPCLQAEGMWQPYVPKAPKEIAVSTHDYQGFEKPYDANRRERYLQAIRNAPNGSRNPCINANGHLLGRLVAGGRLEPEATLEALKEAALEVGDNEAGDLDVVARSWESGLKKPLPEWLEAEERLGTPPAGAIPLPPPEAFTLADLTAWSRTAPRPKPFVMPGFIPARELTLATGAGGANKSTFGQQLATCCAAGIPMLGIDVMGVKALYITAEDDEDRLHWMQAHICNAIGVDIASLSGKLHLASLRGRLGNEIATFGLDGTLHPSASFALLRATIEQTQAGLVVLDNAAHLFVGNENDRQQVTAFVNLLYSLCRDLGATVILVAHTNKAGDSYSGSTAWLNAVRSQIILERPEGSPDPDERVLLLGKANYARQGQVVRFRWRDFALVRDEDLPPDQRAEIVATVKAAAVDERFLQCLAKTNESQRPASLSSSAANFAPKLFVKMPLGKGYNQRDYEDSLERLLGRGVIAGGVPLYKRNNRAWVKGLGVVENCTNPCTNLAPSDAPTCTDPA